MLWIKLTRRTSIGPGSSITSTYNSETTNFATYDLDSVKAYGVAASGWPTAKEWFYIYTGKQGGSIQMQWAQFSSHASNTAIKAYSSLEITEIKTLQIRKK